MAAATWAARIAAGEVVDEHGAPVTAERPFQAQLKVFYYRAVEDEAPLPFEEQVLFQDEQLVVADKPHFLPVTPAGRHLQETLLVRLKRRLGIDTLVPLHRIDRETAGLVMFAVAPAARAAYLALFRAQRVAKVYEAVVHWPPQPPALPLTRCSRIAPGGHFMQMQEVPGEPNAETRFELIEAGAGRAHLRLHPASGRTHQLRVHCAALGLPIVGDTLYPTLQPEGSDDWARPLQLLARSLAFVDPISGAARAFTSRLELQGVHRLKDAGAGPSA